MSQLLKSNYAIHHKIESFFTGSEFLFDESGVHFYCAFGSTINKVCVDDGQVKAQIAATNDEDTVIRFTITPDFTLIIIAYHSGLIKKVGLEDFEIRREFRSIHNAPVAYLKCNPQSDLLATGSSDGTVKLWNLVNHYCTHNLKGINGVVSCIEFLEENEGGRNLLFCSGGDDAIHVFDLANSSKIAKLTTHCSTITSLRFSYDKKSLISCGRDKIAVVWDLSASEDKHYGIVKRTIPLFESVESMTMLSKHQAKMIMNLSKSEAKNIFATIGEEGIVKFWDSKTGSMILSQGVPPLSTDRSPSTQCLQITLRPGHDQIAVASYDRNIFFYHLPDLKLVQQLQGHIDEVFSACWFGKNNTHLAVASNSKELKIIDAGSSKCQHLAGHTDIVLCVKSVPSDRYMIISSAKDCVVLVWKFNPETMISSIIFKGTGHTHAIHSLAVLFSKKTFFSGSEDSTLKSWSFSELNRSAKRKLDAQGTSSLEPRPLISSITIKAHDNRIDALAVSPNDALMATGSRDKTAKIFTVEGLKQIAVLKGHKRGVFAIQFSPVDQVIVTSSGDASLKMWNLQDFACIRTFQGHDCSVLNFAFLSEGLQILSVGSDGNMKLWNCKTTECTKTIDAHDGNTWTLCPTEDENLVITAAQDGKLIIWKDCTKEEQEQRIEKLSEKVLQEQEFVNFVNKKIWKKAFEIAMSLENSNKALNVVREILIDPNGLCELSEIISQLDKLELNFLIESCIQWASFTKNSCIAQTVFNIIVRSTSNSQLLRLPGLTSTMDEMQQLTEKSYFRYEKLVQEATFVDFFLNCFKIQ